MASLTVDSKSYSKGINISPSLEIELVNKYYRIELGDSDFTSDKEVEVILEKSLDGGTNWEYMSGWKVTGPISATNQICETGYQSNSDPNVQDPNPTRHPTHIRAKLNVIKGTVTCPLKLEAV